MTITIRSVFDAAMIGLTVRIAWSIGNTIVDRAAARWNRWLLPLRCPRCNIKLYGTKRAGAHFEQSHGAEVEAERVVQAEATRTILGTLFGRPAADDD